VCKNEAIINPHPYLKLKANKSLVSFGKRDSPYHVEILDLDKPSKTIHCAYSFQPRLFVPINAPNGKFIRELTIKELAQIQGFPKKFKFFGSKNAIIRQIGNAVPPKLVFEISKKIADYMN
jgi:DNA (cytosine-5)-methyltransferase 1